MKAMHNVEETTQPRHSALSPIRLGRSLIRWLERGVVRTFAWLAITVYQLTGNWQGWRPLLIRTSAHLAVIAVAIVAIGLSNIEWPAQAAPMPALPVSAGSEEGAETVQDLLAEINGHNGEVLAKNGNGTTGTVARLAQPRTIFPERPRLGVVTYTVQAGDTVQDIAASFHLSPTTIMWANPAIEDVPDLLKIGQEVVILPLDGVYHKIAEGDTLSSIAEKYEVISDTIIDCQYNNLTSVRSSLKEDTYLIVPGGEKPYVPKVVTSYIGPVPEGARGTGRFQWPVLGRITQEYWYGHRAIDIGAPTGSALLAADGGFVSFAGWTDVGYGYLVVIDHANGFATYYAHLSKIYVYSGEAVERGQVIGAVGSTGWSTGPHLHFEVRYYGEQQNPRSYLY
jgi:murein DD-endopeptidase MepM/ murein hydrolase activator NlpD